MKRNILGSRQIRTKREFLVHHADPELLSVVRISNPNLFTLIKNLAGVRLIKVLLPAPFSPTNA